MNRTFGSTNIKMRLNVLQKLLILLITCKKGIYSTISTVESKIKADGEGEGKNNTRISKENSVNYINDGGLNPNSNRPTNYDNDDFASYETIEELIEEVDQPFEEANGDIYDSPHHMPTDSEEEVNFDPTNVDQLKIIERSQSKHDQEIDKAMNNRLNMQIVISNFEYMILVMSGVYMTFWGLRIFKLLMVILGFCTSYYIILFILIDLAIYEPLNPVHQLSLLFGCVSIGFMVAVFCYIFDEYSYIIFGLASGTILALLYAQFFVNLQHPEHQKRIMVIYVIFCSIFSLAVFFVLDITIIVGSSLIGSVISVINVGFMLRILKPFGEKRSYDGLKWQNFENYLIVIFFLTVSGILSQYYIRRKLIISVIEHSGELEESTYLN